MRKISKTINEDETSSKVSSSNHDDLEKSSKRSKESDESEDEDTPLAPAKNGNSKSDKRKTNSKSRRRSKKKAADSASDDVDEDEGEEEYEVEKVLDSKKIRGKVHYLIRWKGYSSSSDTWEPEDSVSCTNLIEEFKKEQEKREGNAKKATGKKRKIGKKDETPKKKKPIKADFDYENADKDAEYEVDKILEVHFKKNGDREFLIHWKGWSSSHDSWEPEKHLNCKDLIDKFMMKVEKARAVDERALRVARKPTDRYTLSTHDSGRRISKRNNNKQRVRYDDAE